jgi:hypothetical protein
MNSFKKDLDQSRIYELELIKHLDDVDRFEQSPDHYAFSDYDMKIFKKDGTNETYEIKCDRICNGNYKTGNIAIEYQQFRENKMKKTGISTSKSNYWAIFCIDEFNSYDLYVIKRRTLIKMINNQEYITQKKTADNSYFLLFKKDKIKDNCILYKNVTIW